MRGYFQFTPHDVWDYDGSNDLFLLDVLRGGQTIKAVAQPNRNGYLYVLDRTTGRFLHGAQYVDKLNWATGLDELGRPRVNPTFTPSAQPEEFICPGVMGGKNGAYTAAYSPLTTYLYVPVIESCWQVKKKPVFAVIPGVPYWGGGLGKEEQTSYGQFSAIAATSGARQWRYADTPLMVGGTLATGGGLVFTGSQSGHVMAFNDTTGEVLWKFDVGAPVRGQPITYKVDDRQYVAIPIGDDDKTDPEKSRGANASRENILVVFSLPEQQG
jgi:alcohol dehydrogenase (cytochrome c)